MNLTIPSVLKTGVRRRGLLGEESMRRLVLMLATALIPVTRLIAKQWNRTRLSSDPCQLGVANESEMK